MESELSLLDQLVAMGFDRAVAEAAVEQCDSLDAAVEFCCCPPAATDADAEFAAKLQAEENAAAEEEVSLQLLGVTLSSSRGACLCQWCVSISGNVRAPSTLGRCRRGIGIGVGGLGQ